MGQEIGMHSERKQTKKKMVMMMKKKPYKVKQGCHTDQTEGEIVGGGASVNEADGRW